MAKVERKERVERREKKLPFHAQRGPHDLLSRDANGGRRRIGHRSAGEIPRLANVERKGRNALKEEERSYPFTHCGSTFDGGDSSVLGRTTPSTEGRALAGRPEIGGGDA